MPDKLLIPDQSEPFQRDGRVSKFWYAYLDRLTNTLTSTISGIAGAVASIADVRSAAAGKTFETGLIESASAFVTLTDAATVALDWDTFINGTVTLTANRTLGNPTNGQPGTYRTVLIKGNSATPRIVSFGAQYLGGTPTLEDVTSTKWYLATIMCISTTHFLVSARAATT